MAIKSKAAAAKPPKGESVLRAGLREFTRARIVEAAMKLFRTSGFRSTTVEQIAELAGTTVPTFYRHFKSKDDLFGPMHEHLYDEVEQVLLKLDQIDYTSEVAIRGWLDSYMVMWTRMHRLCAAYWEAVHVDEDHARDVFPIAERLTQSLQNILKNADPDVRPQLETNLSFVVMFIDRLTTVVAVEDNLAQANRIMDHIAHLIWSIINNMPPNTPARA